MTRWLELVNNGICIGFSYAPFRAIFLFPGLLACRDIG